MTKEKIFQEIEEALYMHHWQDIHITTIDHIEQILTKHLQDTEEREIDENTSDWYHTFKELYEHRVALYIKLVNDTNYHWEYNWIKSKLHFDWSEFEWWFILMWYIDWKQISYHLPNDKRDLVHCKEVEKADEWNWHTSNDVVNILLWIT